MSVVARPAAQRSDSDRLHALIGSSRVRDGAALQHDESMRAQVCVVGSGAGGATVAHELARRGHSVVILEEGAYRTGREFTGDPVAMAELLQRDRGSTRTLGPLAIPIPLGRCVGGTTVIGSGTSRRVPEAVLATWEREHGVTGLGVQDLAPYYARAEEDLGIRLVPDALYGRNAAVLERGAARLGHAGARVHRGAPACRSTGVCELGCPQDAKLAMHVSYVPNALAAGAILYTRTRAETLLLSSGRVFGVRAQFLGADGVPTGHALRVVADRVVVACGALLTPVLLARSGAGGASGQLGRNLRIHPSARIVARFAGEVRGWAEVPQAFAVDQFLDEGIVIQTQFAQPAALALALPAVGRTHRSIMARYPHLAAVTAQIADGASGRVLPGRGGSPSVRYRLHEADRRRMLRAISLAAEMLFAAGAIEVYPALRGHPVLAGVDEAIALRDAAVAERDLDLVAHHPMGTARMADDKRYGVASTLGAVHDTQDLYVADASLFPASTTVPPQTTIIALALRIAEHISDDLGAPLS